MGRIANLLLLLCVQVVLSALTSLAASATQAPAVAVVLPGGEDGRAAEVARLAAAEAGAVRLLFIELGEPSRTWEQVLATGARVAVLVSGPVDTAAMLEVRPSGSPPVVLLDASRSWQDPEAGIFVAGIGPDLEVRALVDALAPAGLVRWALATSEDVAAPSLLALLSAADEELIRLVNLAWGVDGQRSSIEQAVTRRPAMRPVGVGRPWRDQPGARLGGTGADIGPDVMVLDVPAESAADAISVWQARGSRGRLAILSRGVDGIDWVGGTEAAGVLLLEWCPLDRGAGEAFRMRFVADLDDSPGEWDALLVDVVRAGISAARREDGRPLAGDRSPGPCGVGLWRPDGLLERPLQVLEWGADGRPSPWQPEGSR